MNQFADMITNTAAVIISLIVLWKCPNNRIAGMTMALFGINEACAHTRLDIIAYQKFHDDGLNFPYSPGLAKAVFGFLVVAILLIRNLAKRHAVSVKSFLLVIVCLPVVMAIIVLIPENGLKDMNTPYAFPSAGFCEPYLN